MSVNYFVLQSSEYDRAGSSTIAKEIEKEVIQGLRLIDQGVALCL